MLYTWRVRRRIIRWYGELKKAEAGVRADSSPERFVQALADIDRIEEAVDRIAIPLGFSNQLYDLREHIDVVRRRLSAIRAPTHGSAKEALPRTSEPRSRDLRPARDGTNA